jgi:hypothetical protein
MKLQSAGAEKTFAPGCLQDLLENKPVKYQWVEN